MLLPTTEPEPTEPAPTPYSEIGELDPFLQGVMKNNVNHNRDAEAKSNYKLLKTIIPIDLNMTIDGVGGLMPGNLFRVDYLPEMYRKYCYFQIFTVSHQINTSGWSTSITAKMKLDFPKLYKEKILVIDDIDESTPDLSEEEKEMIEEAISIDIPMETVEAESTSVNVDVDIDSLEELPEDFQEMSNEETLDYLGIGGSN